MNKLFQTAKILMLALVLSFGLSYALAWTPPTATPPNGNIDAPVNTGSGVQTKSGNFTAPNLLDTSATAQTKAGSLTVSGLNLNTKDITNAWNIVGNSVTTNTLKVVTGAGAGRVLTSDATGNATWGVTTESDPKSLGVGQTWQDLKASRVVGTTYTNTTVKPIAVSVASGVNGATGSTSQISVNGAVVSSCTVGAAYSNCNAFTVVPPGATYLVYLSYIYLQAGTSGQYWNELR